jgi:hypothetical protein
LQISYVIADTEQLTVAIEKDRKRGGFVVGYTNTLYQHFEIISYYTCCGDTLTGDIAFWLTGGDTLGHCCLDVGECWIMNDVWPPTTTTNIIF